MSIAWAPYFTVDEMSCPCCGRSEMDKDFMYALWWARRESEIPMPVTSGYRCNLYNRSKKINGAPDSRHVKGTAADISCTDSTKRAILVSYLLKHKLSVLVYPRHLHVDLRQGSVILALG